MLLLWNINILLLCHCSSNGWRPAYKMLFWQVNVFFFVFLAWNLLMLLVGFVRNDLKIVKKESKSEYQQFIKIDEDSIFFHFIQILPLPFSFFCHCSYTLCFILWDICFYFEMIKSGFCVQSFLLQVCLFPIFGSLLLSKIMAVLCYRLILYNVRS